MEPCDRRSYLQTMERKTLKQGENYVCSTQRSYHRNRGHRGFSLFDWSARVALETDCHSSSGSLDRESERLGLSEHFRQICLQEITLKRQFLAISL